VPRDDITLKIKKRLLISSIVKQAIELKGNGSHFLGLCPFHQEKTPSFHVRDHIGSFKCFGCGASGDIFAFIMRLRGISFKEALNELSEKAGLSDTPLVRQVRGPQINYEEQLLRAQSIAQRFFIEQLATPGGRAVVEYLVKNRRLAEPMIKQAALGFGGNSTKDFLNYLAKNQISEKVAIEAGLLKPGTFSKSAQFLGRITFPIKNTDGKIIAFGGRLVADDPAQPKYVNTHAYVHYEKKKHFYGLFESKPAILRGQTPILVEGYFDAMAMWAAGVPALALCGTALSDEHALILKRLSSRLTICFDADEAGYKALRSALQKLWRSQISVSAVVLDKNDPADYLASGQLSELKERIKKPIDATCLVIDRVALSVDSDITTRIVEIDELLPIFAAIPRPLVRRQYVAYLAQKLHEDPAILWSEIGQKARKNQPSKNVMKAEEKPVLKLNAEEKWLAQILRSAPLLVREISKSLWEKVRVELRPIFLAIEEQPQGLDHFLGEESEQLLLSLSEARDMLVALEGRLGQQGRRQAIKIKRAELQLAEKQKDFESMFKSLREQSTLLAGNKILVPRPKLVPEAPVRVPKAPIKVNEMAKIDTSSIDLDHEEDWL
jgi:DNA primase